MKPIDLQASQAEWDVMRIVWSLEKPTSRDISTVLKQTKNWEPSTTKTLLSRLVKKGYLDVEKDGKSFIYFPMMTEEDSVTHRVNGLFDSFCEKKVGTAIAEAVDSYDLTEADIDIIMTLLKNKKASDHIRCSCIPEECSCEGMKCTCHLK